MIVGGEACRWAYGRRDMSVRGPHWAQQWGWHIVVWVLGKGHGGLEWCRLPAIESVYSRSRKTSKRKDRPRADDSAIAWQVHMFIHLSQCHEIPRARSSESLLDFIFA